MVIVGGSFSKHLYELIRKYFYSSQTSALWHSYLWTSLLAFGEIFEQTICMITLLSLLCGYKQSLCKGHSLNWHNFISVLFQLAFLRLQFDHLLSVCTTASEQTACEPGKMHLLLNVRKYLYIFCTPLHRMWLRQNVFTTLGSLLSYRSLGATGNYSLPRGCVKLRN